MQIVGHKLHLKLCSTLFSGIYAELALPIHELLWCGNCAVREVRVQITTVSFFELEYLTGGPGRRKKIYETMSCRNLPPPWLILFSPDKVPRGLKKGEKRNRGANTKASLTFEKSQFSMSKLETYRKN